MSIARKPERSKSSDRQIEALINKGGDVPATHVRPQPERQRRRSGQVVLRIPVDLLSRVDTVVAAQPLPTTRHAWLLEAILEKVERESI